MAFLSKKGFNPQNQVNRKQVWEARQHSKLEEERIRKREDQLRKEREDEEICASRHKGDSSQAQLRFMYDAPPGMKQSKESHGGENDTDSKQRKTLGQATAQDLTKIQSTDDAAAAAFRRMLAASAAPTQETTANEGNDAGAEDGEGTLGFAPVLQGTTMERDFENEKNNDTRSALEKAVGRRDRGSALTLEEQVARFPQLKHAPMAKGMSSADVNVSFKPLGAQLRNVKCLACGVWGHSRGDRECKMTGWDPFSMSGKPVVPVAPLASSSIRPKEEEIKKKSKRRKDGDRRRDRSEDGNSSDSLSSASSLSSVSSLSSGEERRRRRRRKRHSKHHRTGSHRERSSSRRKHSRKHRDESPSRRSESRRSHKRHKSRRDDK